MVRGSKTPKSGRNTQQRTKRTTIKVGKTTIVDKNKTFTGNTYGERRHEARMAKIARDSDPTVVTQKEKTKRGLAYAGSVASSANSAAAATKQTVILAEGGINPSTSEDENPKKDQNSYTWGGL